MHNAMTTRAIGNRSVSAIGLGAMPMSVAGHMPDEDQSIRTILAALDAGVTLIDTADAYTPSHDDVGHNERLVAKALARCGRRRRRPCSSRPRAGTPARRAAAGRSTAARPTSSRRATGRCKALGVERIGLYQHHRPDPKVPYEETIGRAQGPVRRRQDRDGGHLERRPGADPARPRHPRRPAGERPEPVLAAVPVQRARDRRLRRARPGLPALVPARRHRPWRGAGRAGGLRRDRRRRAACPRSRSASPGSSPAALWSSPSPAPAARRPSSTPSAPPTLELTAEELARLG